MSWKWDQFWNKMISGLRVGLLLGLFFGLFGLVGGVPELKPSYGLLGLALGLSAGGMLSGCSQGLSCGFVREITDRVKASPNQGIKLSGKNASTAFLVACLSPVPLGGLTGAAIGPYVSEGLYFALSVGLTVGLSVGLIFGLILGSNLGGSAVIKHYALRLIFWLSGYTPFKFIKFLDHCAKLIFLKKVGGGYIFIHRMLLEYFADLTPKSRERSEMGKYKDQEE